MSSLSWRELSSCSPACSVFEQSTASTVSSSHSLFRFANIRANMSELKKQDKEQRDKEKEEEEEKNIKALDSRDIEILKTYVHLPLFVLFDHFAPCCYPPKLCSSMLFFQSSLTILIHCRGKAPTTTSSTSWRTKSKTSLKSSMILPVRELRLIFELRFI